MHLCYTFVTHFISFVIFIWCDEILSYIIAFHSSSSQRLMEMSTGSISLFSFRIIKCFILRLPFAGEESVSLISDSFLVTCNGRRVLFCVYNFEVGGCILINSKQSPQNGQPHLVVVSAVLLYPALHLGCRLLPPGGQAATRLPGTNSASTSSFTNVRFQL